MNQQAKETLRDAGLLVLRVGLGVMFMLHGWGKISGGMEMWEKLGGAMANLGITFMPAFWGFMAAFAEFGGGLMLALGLLTRVAGFLMFFTMIVAVTVHVSKGDDMGGWSHAAEAGIVFFSLILIGPGAFSADAILFKKKN